MSQILARKIEFDAGLGISACCYEAADGQRTVNAAVKYRSDVSIRYIGMIFTGVLRRKAPATRSNPPLPPRN